MYLQALAPVWRDLYRQLVTQTQVLVVDDEPEIADLVKNILSTEGYTVTHALSAEAALRMLGQNARFDLAIVDQHLPGPVRGAVLRAQLSCRVVAPAPE